MILPANDWQLVSQQLTILACLSIFRPITWVLSAYLEAEAKTNRLMVLEIAKVVLLISGITVLKRLGVRTASAAVGLAFVDTARFSRRGARGHGEQPLTSTWTVAFAVLADVEAAGALITGGNGLSAVSLARVSAFLGIEATQQVNLSAVNH